MKISKDDFDLVKRKFGDDGDNLTWTDGEVLLDGGSRPEELVEEMQGLARRFHFREDPMGFVDNLSRECAERENWKKSVFNQTPRELSKRKIKRIDNTTLGSSVQGALRCHAIVAVRGGDIDSCCFV